MTGTHPEKVYLGDGCYADFDGFQIILTAENGISTQARIAVEPQVYSNLRNYAKSINEIYKVRHFNENITLTLDDLFNQEERKNGRTPPTPNSGGSETNS